MNPVDPMSPSSLSTRIPEPGAFSPEAAGGTKESVKVRKIVLRQMSPQATPQSPRTLRSPRTDAQDQPAPPASPRAEKQAPSGGEAVQQACAKTDDARGDGDPGNSSSPPPSSMPLFRIRRSTVTLQGGLLTIPRSTPSLLPSPITPSSPPTSTASAAPLSTSSTPAAPATSDTLLVTLLVDDVVQRIRSGPTRAVQLDRAFALARLPAQLKDTIKDRTQTYIPTRLLVMSLFGPVIERSEAWRKALAVRTEVLRSDSRRQVSDADMTGDRLSNGKSMLAPWAQKMANTLIGDLSHAGADGLPREVFSFLVDLDHALHTALLNAVPGMSSDAINQQRFAMLYKVLVEGCLLSPEEKLRPPPPTALQFWFSESLRDASQELLKESAKGFFEQVFKTAPPGLQSAIVKMLVAELKEKEQAETEGRKKLVMERTASLQRRAAAGHVRSNSDNVAKFEDITKKKARESNSRKLLVEVMAQVDFRGLPDEFPARLSKGFRALLSGNASPSRKDVLCYIRDVVSNYMTQDSLTSEDRKSAQQIIDELGHKIDAEAQAKAARRATRVTASLKPAFLDRLFSANRAENMFDEAEEVFIPTERDSPRSGSTSSTSSVPANAVTEGNSTSHSPLPSAVAVSRSDAAEMSPPEKTSQ